MSGSILEKSLDEIIGENKPISKSRSAGPSRRQPHPRVNKPQRPRYPPSERHDTYKPSQSIPREISSLANSRPLLRVKNIHHELNGEDLSNLFSGVAPVEFVKFDPKKDSVAYVCFESDNSNNNSIAISKFDGKKAMGKILIVESATSLADRIVVPVRDSYNRPPRGPGARVPGARGPGSRGPGSRDDRPNQRRKLKHKPVKKSIDILDEELSAYMSGKSEGELKKESKLISLDNELDDYWNSSAPNENNETSAPVEHNGNNDEMNID